MRVDTSFDYRLDARGKDPDLHSPTMRLDHQTLWSKPLPSGTVFELQPEPGKYLVHRSDLGTFFLGSDRISNSLRKQKSMAAIIEHVPTADLDAFQRLGATAGAGTLFPSNKVDGGLTINVMRGFTSTIGDRIDLTLECIKRHYVGASSPLSSTLARYEDFFALFETFEGYVEFFLFQDLVVNGEVQYFIPFDGTFSRKANPRDLAEYLIYKENVMTFLERRNARIDASY